MSFFKNPLMRTNSILTDAFSMTVRLKSYTYLVYSVVDKWVLNLMVNPARRNVQFGRSYKID